MHAKSGFASPSHGQGAGHDAMILAEKFPAAIDFFCARPGASATIRRNPCIWTTCEALGVRTAFADRSLRLRRNFWEGRAMHNLGQTRSSHHAITGYSLRSFVRTALPA